MAKKSSNLVKRVGTAAVGIPVLLAIIFLAPPWATFALVGFAGVVSVWEYCSITYGDEHRLGKAVSAALGGALAATLYFAPAWFFHASVATFLVVFLLFLFTYTDKERVSHQIGSSLTGILYGGVVLTTLALLVRETGGAGPYWVLFALAVTWSSDTGAYFAGKNLGKHKLYEAVSPKKTIEGSIGGLVASVLAAFLLDYAFSFDAAWTSLELWHVLLLAIPGNILSQLGDLCESLIKRAHGVKDSGHIIPGHGGMLDRIDGVVFAAPWFFFAVTEIVL